MCGKRILKAKCLNKQEERRGGGSPDKITHQLGKWSEGVRYHRNIYITYYNGQEHMEK